MKSFLHKCMITFSLIILGSSLVPDVIYGKLSESWPIVQILLATVVIHLGQLLTNRFNSPYHLLEILLEFAMVMAVVLAFGWFFGWYDLAYLWMIVTIVIIVYIANYVLDVARTKKDVQFINQQIRMRKERMQSMLGGEDRQS